jgi:hypothetical protein
MPSVSRGDIACAEWSDVRGFEHFLKLLDLINDAVNIHAPQSSKKAAKSST